MRVGNPITIGARFGRLVVIEDTHSKCVLAVCDCGNAYITARRALRVGSIQSCGCRHIEMQFKHGQTKTPLFRVWVAMKQRCHNPSDKWYSHYGARGISVCDEWRESFEAFRDHMGPRPSKAHSIDRINNDGNYEPGNMRWATPKEQTANRRPYPANRKQKVKASGNGFELTPY